MDILNFWKGSKSVIGVIGAIAAFVVLITTQLSDGFQVTDIQAILAGFSAMMLAIGWTGKLANLENESKK